MNDKVFTFEISLSVLNHLGRNLYRSFATVLGEAISNSWDADAENVWIYFNKDENFFMIKDDGYGMTSDDFQQKFLKIGYTKRKDGETASTRGRPYIGRKGIGKLALLSCADKITVISKIQDGDYVGGLIDNSGLDKAITEDLSPSDYPLENMDLSIFGDTIEGHEKGTLIFFEGLKGGIKNTSEYLRKIIALYFRFSLVLSSNSNESDEFVDTFNIFLNDQLITLDDLNDLAQNTEFLWNLNELDDPYIKKQLKNLLEPEKAIKIEGDVKGFIASVKKPSHLKVFSTDERIGIDLFVNGRMRERNILKHVSVSRIAESYLYGQIHYNDLDDEKDRFTSSREGIVADDSKYNNLLDNLRKFF